MTTKTTTKALIQTSIAEDRIARGLLSRAELEELIARAEDSTETVVRVDAEGRDVDGIDAWGVDDEGREWRVYAELDSPSDLSLDQIEAVEAAGRKVAEGWLREADTAEAADADYDFGGEGDWQLVKAAARASGVDWAAGDAQPARAVYSEVWAAATRGYRARLDG